MSQEFDIVQEVLAQFDEGNDLVDDVLAELVAGGTPVQGFAPGGVITDQTPNYDKPYNKDLADAAAKAAAVVNTGMSNVGGWTGGSGFNVAEAITGGLWDATPQPGSAGSAVDMFYKNLVIEEGVARVDELSKSLSSPEGTAAIRARIDANMATKSAEEKASSPVGVASLIDDVIADYEAGSITVVEGLEQVQTLLETAAKTAGVTDSDQIGEIVSGGVTALQEGGNGETAVSEAVTVAEENGALTKIADAAAATATTIGEAATTVLNADVPGLKDVGVIGDVMDVVFGGIGNVVGTVIGTFCPECNNEITIGPGGVAVVINTDTQNKNTGGGGTVVATEDHGNGSSTRVVIDTGSKTGDLVLTGGTGADVSDIIFGEEGVFGSEGVFSNPDVLPIPNPTTTEVIQKAACAMQGGTWSCHPFWGCRCVPSADTTAQTGTATTTQSQTEGEGTEGEATEGQGGDGQATGQTTVTVGGSLPDGPCFSEFYAYTHPDECILYFRDCNGSPLHVTKTCKDAEGCTDAQQALCPGERTRCRIVPVLTVVRRLY